MKKIIGIDFDGTCVTDLYPYVGDNIGAASVLRELGDKNLLILYTVRDGKYLQDAVDWERYGRMRDRRMTMSIFPSRIIIRRSYSQKVLSVD